jgi:ABC-type branched-subunit amino acid transport system substrate-binding protein
MPEATGPLPILLGVLYDYPQVDGGAAVEEAFALGLTESFDACGFDRPFELVARQGKGLPSGSAFEMERSVTELIDAGVLAVLGPSISDNALIVQPVLDAAGVPAVNYTGGERNRSHFMFHYQVGSLAEEPVVLARHLAAQGVTSVALLHDHSPVGQGYAASFVTACEASRIELVGRGAVSPLAVDVSASVRRVRAGGAESLAYMGLGVAARAVALGVAAEGWDVPVVANSSLMFGYLQPDWRAGWEGWVYTDTVADDNPARAALRQRSRRSAAGPVGVASYDIGRLLGLALARAPHLTRDGVRDSLEEVKRLPAASGLAGTVMGFGHYDHAALKGPFLVLRRWEEGRSVQLAEQQ